MSAYDPKRTFPSQRPYVTRWSNRSVHDAGVSLELTVGLYVKRRVTTICCCPECDCGRYRRIKSDFFVRN